MQEGIVNIPDSGFSKVQQQLLMDRLWKEHDHDPLKVVTIVDGPSINELGAQHSESDFFFFSDSGETIRLMYLETEKKNSYQSGNLFRLVGTTDLGYAFIGFYNPLSKSGKAILATR